MSEYGYDQSVYSTNYVPISWLLRSQPTYFPRPKQFLLFWFLRWADPWHGQLEVIPRFVLFILCHLFLVQSSKSVHYSPPNINSHSHQFGLGLCSDTCQLVGLHPLSIFNHDQYWPWEPSFTEPSRPVSRCGIYCNISYVQCTLQVFVVEWCCYPWKHSCALYTFKL